MPHSLQWCHRLSAMERPHPVRAIGGVRHASMVPSPLSDGKAGGIHRPLAGRHASMVPSPLSDGKSRVSHWTASSAAGFNGAIASQRWKEAADLAPVLVGGHASMVPSPLSDGKAPSSREALPTPASFNGAIASQRWKELDWFIRSELIPQLQWCHRLSAMESHRRTDGGDSPHRASMVPSPLSDGKISLPTSTTTP